MTTPPPEHDAVADAAWPRKGCTTPHTPWLLSRSTVRLSEVQPEYTTVMQSWNWDNKTADLYTVQIVQGGVLIPGESGAGPSHDQRTAAGDLCFTQLCGHGHKLATMWFRGSGHGNQIGVENDPEDGSVWIWTGSNAEAQEPGSGINAHSRSLARIRFTGNKVVTNAGITHYNPTGQMEHGVSVNVDPTPEAERLVVVHGENNEFTATLYDLAKARNNQWEPLHQLTYETGQPPPEGPSVMQGMASLGGYFYLQHGRPDGTMIWIARYSWTTGVMLQNTPMGLSGVEPHREPEGLAVQLPKFPDGPPVLWHGLATGPAGSRKAAFASMGKVCDCACT
ncbi:hypothetical protein DY218_27315 [Streptomyces triticagri]|uniref:P68 RBP/TagC-like beta-propeller domain-containing protein n=1 Tax=Streptomyces triticagri TaxID=2293568 RepID=A0A372LYI3_9ACTN|nr:hypothetical protein [Streptomyces triticagri]RFU83619.1 hypothetical protein DY218_27315 [Streptomyces triticagri]